MIHNPTVNEDLLKKGMKFLQHTDGSERIPIDSLSSEDIVIVPAFGTTVEIEEQLKEKELTPTPSTQHALLSKKFGNEVLN